MKTLTSILALSIVSIPSLAAADTAEVIKEYGVSASAGGGFAQFTDSGMRDYATEGVSWEARLGFGTKKMLSFEASYVGSLYAIDALGLDQNASLLGTGVEGNLRLNFLSGAVRPYILAGGGWTHYKITNTDTNTSDVATTDNIAQIPLGAGLAFQEGPVIIDARAVYRASTNVDMFAGATDNSVDSWTATIRAGFEY